MWGLLYSTDQIGDFCNPNPFQNFHWIIKSDPNPLDLSKYLIQWGLCPKKTLIGHSTSVINAVWISISDLVEFFQNPVRTGFGSECRIRLDRDPQTGSCSTLLLNCWSTPLVFLFVVKHFAVFCWPRAHDIWFQRFGYSSAQGQDKLFMLYELWMLLFRLCNSFVVFYSYACFGMCKCSFEHMTLIISESCHMHFVEFC